MAASILRWISLASALGRRAVKYCNGQTVLFYQHISTLPPGQTVGSPIVTDVQPRRIGFGGGAVTIHGQVGADYII